jgi:hypothetical protein
MKKKILASLLIASLAITGLFAYSSPKAILDATKADTEYTFAIQYANGTLGDEATATESLVLSTAEVTTGSDFTVATATVGNLGSDITVTAIITTGEFLGDSSVGSNSTPNTGLFPKIVENVAGNSLALISTETFSYGVVSGSTSSYTAANNGSFTRTLLAGRHELNTEIARFKLNYKGNDVITAGDYTSTSTVEITTV